ncbi:MAG: protein-disulfide reductase DsbD domain-containing protein [Planctomycetota bacterium]
MVCWNGCRDASAPRDDSRRRSSRPSRSGAGAGVGIVAAGAFLAGLAVAGMEQVDLDKPKAKVRLVSAVESVPPGHEIYVGLDFTIEPGWHLYWDGQNDTGFAPAAAWSAPEGVRIGEVRWPTPKRYISPGDILDHVYEDQFTLIVPIRVPKDAEIGSTIELTADLEWLVCKDICIPEFAEVSLSIPITERPAPSSSGGTTIARGSRTLPSQKLPPEMRWAWRGDELTISVPNASKIAFYPSRHSAPVGGLLEFGEQKGSTLSLPIDRSRGDEVAGILQYWTAPAPSATPTPGPASGRIPPNPSATQSVAIRIPTSDSINADK